MFGHLCLSHMLPHTHTHTPFPHPTASVRHDSSALMNTLSMQSVHRSPNRQTCGVTRDYFTCYTHIHTHTQLYLPASSSSYITSKSAKMCPLSSLIFSPLPTHPPTFTHLLTHPSVWSKYRAETVWHSDLQRNSYTLPVTSTGACAFRKAMNTSWLSHGICKAGRLKRRSLWKNTAGGSAGLRCCYTICRDTWICYQLCTPLDLKGGLNLLQKRKTFLHFFYLIQV